MAIEQRVFFVARLVPDGIRGDVARFSLCLLPRAGADVSQGDVKLAAWPTDAASLFSVGSSIALVARKRGSIDEKLLTAQVVNGPSPAAASVWTSVIGGAEGFDWLWKALKQDQAVTKTATAGPNYNRSYVLSYRSEQNATFLAKAWPAPAVKAIEFLVHNTIDRLADSLLPSAAHVGAFHGLINMFGSDTGADTLDRSPAASVTQRNSGGLPDVVKKALGRMAPAPPPPIKPALLNLLGRRRSDRDTDTTQSTGPGIAESWTTALAAARQEWINEQQAFGAAFDAGQKQRQAVLKNADRIPRAQRNAEFAKMLDQLISSDALHQRNGRNDSDLNQILASEPARDFQKSYGMFQLATRRSSDWAEDADEKAERTPEALARRKLAAILTQPVLARKLGFTIDVTVPVAELQKHGLTGYFEIAYQRSAADRLWTAAKFGGAFLGPAPYYEYHNLAHPLTGVVPRPTDGLLDLNQTVKGAPRYRLEQYDTAIGLESWENAGRSRLNQKLQGDGAAASRKAPAVLGDMIGLADDYAAHSTLEDIKSDISTRRTLYEEDLRAGYRLDLGVFKAGVWPTADRWRSLTECEVQYSELHSDFVRSDGWFEPMARLADTGDQAEAREVISNPVMCWWAGDSLAMPARGSADAESDAFEKREMVTNDKQLVTWLTPSDDAAIRTNYRYPTGTDAIAGPAKRLPPPRYGLRYAAGIRVALINGGGVTLQQASMAYAGKKFTLGEQACHLLRHDEIGAPVILLPPSDTLARAATLSDLNGEQLHSLILRSGASGSSRAVTRYLVVPRAAFATIAMHGMLDGDNDDTPRGAYEQFALDSQSGEFVALPPIPVTSGAKPTSAGSRGQVLRASNSKPKNPYYPDPLAERCCLMFSREERVPPGFGSGDKLDVDPLIIPVSMRERWPEALALELEVVPIEGNYNLRGRMKSVGTEEAPKVRIELAKGETINLVAWMIPAAPQALIEHALFSNALALSNSISQTQSSDAFASIASRLSGIMALAERDTLVRTDFDKIFGRLPIPALSKPTVMTLTHACDRPVLAPAPKTEAGTPEPKLSFALIRPALQGEKAEIDWAAKVKALPSSQVLNLPNEPGATRAFVAGAVRVERMSTGRVSLQAKWAEAGPSATHRNADGSWDYHLTVSDWQELALIDLRSFGSGGALTDVDLTFDDGAPRALSHEFGDSRARRLDLRVVTYSRYRPFFDGAKPSDPNDQESFSRAGTIATDYWIPATARPPQPSIKDVEVLPVSRFRTEPLANGFKITRTSELELRFTDWDLSGEGELLGIACPLPGDQNVQQLDEKAYGPFLSRRGHDPMFRSGTVQPWLEAHNFPGKNPRAQLMMPYNAVEASGVGGTNLVKVQVYGMRPTFDRATADWIFRVALDEGQAYAPFIRLGLVRWQQHAIDNHELSFPVPVVRRLLPKRTVTATYENERKLHVVIEGQNYRETAPSADPTNIMWHRSHIELKLYYERDGEIAPVIEPSSEQPYVRQTRGHENGSGSIWEFNVDLPVSHRDRIYHVWLEEFGLIPGDDGALATKAIRFEQHFQCKIDMRSGLSA